MKAVMIERYGEPGVLRLRDDVAEPHPGPGQVRVRVRAAGVNAIDWKIRSGAAQARFPVDFPAVLGTDVAGVVDEVGERVEGIAPGDEVAGWAVGGAYAELALVEDAARKPAEVPWELAAGLPTAGETALRTLDELAVRNGETLLVHAAAGGVGTLAVQLAVARGATVVGTAGAANQEHVRALGATPVRYGDRLVERVRAAAPQGVDAALDAAGRDALPASIELTGGTERVLTIADARFAELGVRLSARPTHRDALPRLLALCAAGELRLPIDAAFPLAEASAAHRRSEAGHLRGKLVLTVD